MDEVDPPLDQFGVSVELVGGDGIEGRILLHSHKEVSVTEPLDSVVSAGDGSERNFGIE
jgi:hypothetical protein